MGIHNKDTNFFFWKDKDTILIAYIGLMLLVARNRERVLTFVIDYQWSQPKSVSEGERLSEAETEQRSERE